TRLAMGPEWNSLDFLMGWHGAGTCGSPTFRRNRRIAMIWLRKTCLALIAGSVLSTLGCCYHAQQFGRTRDIGWGEIGCDTCKSSGGCGTTSCGPNATGAKPARTPTMVTLEPPQGNSTYPVRRLEAR